MDRRCARIGTFNPGAREFFSEVDYRDRQIMLDARLSLVDLAQMVKDPRGSDSPRRLL